MTEIDLVAALRAQAEEAEDMAKVLRYSADRLEQQAAELEGAVKMLLRESADLLKRQAKTIRRLRSAVEDIVAKEAHCYRGTFTHDRLVALLRETEE